MSRRRLYARELPAQMARLSLDDESRHHAQVLRLAVGDELRLFDALGREADARVVRCDRRALECEVAPAELIPPPAERLQLAVCLPKAAKLELIVRMTSELGLHELSLVHSERSVPKWSEGDPKLGRLQRIAIEACAQSEQAYAPLLRGPVPLSAALASIPEDSFRCAFLERSQAGLSPRELPAGTRAVWAIVGPEGGFAPSEVELLQERGLCCISLGGSILRVETACVVGCALLLDRMRSRA